MPEKERERVGTCSTRLGRVPVPVSKLTFRVETPQRVQVQVVAEISERHDLFFR